MGYTLVISDEKLETALGDINSDIFTSLDFAHAYKALYPEEWVNFTRRYGDLGELNRYSLLDYFNNRLEYYSHKKEASLQPIPRFTTENKQFFRPITEDERNYYDTPLVMLFHKK